MDKVEKFRELLDQHRVLREEFYTNMVVKDFNELVKTEKELIKMYDEKQEKPVIYCREYEVIKIEDKLFYVLWQGKFDNQTVVTHALEEKDGMLIADDFIFVKTD